MKNVYYEINDLISAEYNPRKISDKQMEELKDSIKRFGFVEPVIVNINSERKNIVVSGHQRIKAAKELKYNKIPCIEIDLTIDKEKELNIRMNKSGGEFDFDILQEFFEKNDLIDWGFDENELVFDFEELEPEETIGDDDCPDVIQDKPRTIKGDIYELNNHRLMCGDRTLIDDVEKLMNGLKANLIVTDPPYNVNYEGKTNDALKIQNDSMNKKDFYGFLYNVYLSLYAVAEDGAAIYVFHADSEGYNFRKAMLDAGWKMSQCLIWKKQKMVMGRQDYHWQHEPILYGWKDTAAHNWYSDRKQTTVLEFDRPFRNDIHPTMKPIDLIMYLIQNSSKQKDNVLDLFGGSGSTLIACEKTNRINYSMELDEKYCDVIVQRYVNFCHQNDIKCKIKLNSEDITKNWMPELK